MKDRSTKFNLDKNKLRQLLKMGLKNPKTQSADPEQKMVRLWHELQSKPLPMDEERLELLPDILSDFCQTLGLLTGDRMGEYLRNPKTELSIVENIKQYAKTLSRTSRSDDEHIVANTLYYAAIAHALLYHETKITGYSYAELVQAFEKLRRMNWIEKHFVQLFTKACRYSKRKKC